MGRNNRSLAPLPPMPLSCVWEFRPTRALLLGIIDPGSVLYRLPKSDGVLNIILGFVVLYYEREASALNLFLEAAQGSLTQWQMTLVACFAPDRVNETDGCQETPLHSAAQNGHSESVQLLLTAKGNIHAENEYKETPLHSAAQNGHSESVRLLLTAKSNVNAVDTNRYTPL